MIPERPSNPSNDEETLFDPEVWRKIKASMGEPELAPMNEKERRTREVLDYGKEHGPFRIDRVK